MLVQRNPYAFISLIGSALILFTAMLVLPRKQAAGGRYLLALLLSSALWAFGDSLENNSVQFGMRILWAKVQYMGSMTVPVYWLLFAGGYSNRQKWFPRRVRLALFAIPVLVIALAFTNEWHHLLWPTITVSPEHPYVLLYGHGLIWWVGNFAYSNLLLLAGTILVIAQALSLTRTYLVQSLLVLLSILPPWAGSLMYALGFNPVPGMELAPLAIGISGAILSYAVLRFQLMDVIPIAREALIDTMTDGMLVLDTQSRLVDFNPAAVSLLGRDLKPFLQAAVEPLSLGYPPLLTILAARELDARLIEVVPDNQGRFIDTRRQPVRDTSGVVTGLIIVLRDITPQTLARQKIEQLNEDLAFQLAEVQKLTQLLEERAIRDGLTGLHNRRFLDETLETEFARGRRAGIPISILMIDIDHFKQLNDTLGHKAGDEALKQLAAYLLSKVRKGDLVCRYGGEEFILVLPGMDGTNGQSRAEDIRQGFEQLVITYGDHQIRKTCSIGLALFPDDGQDPDAVTKAADDALYQAKREGRNRVVRSQGARQPV